jgi:hypothetical protein
MKGYDRVLIAGAGLSGLIAATQFPGATIAEKAMEPAQQHQAVLRFRSDVVSRATQIPFRKVMVHKTIFHDNLFHSVCTPMLANLYSQKVLGTISDRSIWDLRAVERFIAPSTFYDQLIDSAASRIAWNTDVSGAFEFNKTPIISTIPMEIAARKSGVDVSDVKFEYASIHVLVGEIPSCDVHQTIYFPEGDTTVYRASITGNKLIIECVAPPDKSMINEVLDCFGIGHNVDLATQRQKYGKIVPIADRTRKDIMLAMTMSKNVYSLGRFATWRNILLDDLVQDIEAIKTLMESSSYNRFLSGAGK